MADSLDRAFIVKSGDEHLSKFQDHVTSDWFCYGMKVGQDLRHDYLCIFYARFELLKHMVALIAR